MLKRGLHMYVVCKEHLEIAIDMFVDEYEEAPDIVDLEETKFKDWTLRLAVSSVSGVEGFFWLFKWECNGL